MSKPLHQIWRLGCAGAPLEEDDQNNFERMARNRFYTFQLGMEHAAQQQTETAPLVKGMASELLESPGLERAWLNSEFSEALHGLAVKREISARFEGSR